MKYFITGATGFVGSWVTEKLIKQGAEVTCLVRKTSNLRWINHLPVKYHYGSLTDLDSLKKGVESVDYVLHIGGVTKTLNVKEFYQGNVQATKNLLTTVIEVNPNLKKFVHISSQAAVGPSESKNPIDETHSCHPLTHYGKSKLETEMVVHQFLDKIPITILRPSTVYGPRDTDVYEAFRNIKSGINLKVGKNEQYISLIHVFDLVDGIINTAKSEGGIGETYFICNDQINTWSEVIEIMKKLVGKKALNLSVPYSVAYGVASVIELIARIRRKPTILDRQKMKEIREQYWTASSQKFKTQLGFSPQLSVEEGFEITYKWYKKNLWL